MDVIESWRAPHHFTLLRADDDPAPTQLQPVFTYTLASMELATADLSDGVPERLIERIGYEWLASLADRLREKPVSDLTAFLQSEVGIAHAGQESGSAAIGLPHETQIPRAVVKRFERKDLLRIREWVDGQVAPLLREISTAADERRRPIATRDGIAAARRLMDIYRPALTLAPLRDSKGRTVWGLSYENLCERIAVELFELYTTRPLLRRCRFCGRVFVPRRRNEGSCRSYLWPASGDGALELCIPNDAARALHDREHATAHKRKRKRLHQAKQRAIRDFGAGNPRTKRAMQDYADWMAENRQRPGPKPRSSPDITSESASR